MMLPVYPDPAASASEANSVMEPDSPLATPVLGKVRFCHPSSAFINLNVEKVYDMNIMHTK